MPDFLTRRNGTWHFVRRVPAEYAAFDKRGIVRHSTKIRITADRTGRRASAVADQLNAALEAMWRQLAGEIAATAAAAYDEVRRRARSMGFEYLAAPEIAAGLQTEKVLERLEALLSRKVENDPTARAAVLGTRAAPSFKLSQLFIEYERVVLDETTHFSKGQLKVWRNTRARAVKQLVEVVGDKDIAEFTQNDAIDFSDWWRERVIAGEVDAGSANKCMGVLSKMLKRMSIRGRLNLPEHFKGLKLKGTGDKSRSPFDPEFIQNRLFAPGALDGLNDEARHIIYVLADTGLRPSEAANLTEKTIHLDAPIPYVEIVPEGRVLKTFDSKRQIPLVGTALAAMKLNPKGFPRYRDNTNSLSALVNKYLSTNGLRPSKTHSLYSFRHSFKDRLVAAQAQDSMIDSLMGHSSGKSKYGNGPSLELKRALLESIAFTPPSRL